MAQNENGIVKDNLLFLNDLTKFNAEIIKIGYVQKRSQYLKNWNE